MSDGGGLHVQLIDKRAELPLSAQEWSALLADNETNTIFQTYQWFDAWWKGFGALHELFFLVVRRDEQIIGFAAMMLSPSVLGMRCLEFVGSGNADYQDFVLPTAKPEAVDAICAFLRANAARWQHASLSNIPSESSTLALLAVSGRRAGLYFVHEARVRCPTLRLEGHEAAVKELARRYSMRRPLNWFSRQGTVTFRHLVKWAEIEALLPVFFDQHVRRWQGVGKRSSVQDAHQQNFYRELASLTLERGWLLFSVVELDGRPLAFHFGFDYRRAVLWYKPSFEVHHANHSPGLLLIQQLIEDALRRERREIDFTIGNEPFKSRFANAERWNLYVGAYHSQVIYLAAVLVKHSRRLASYVLQRVRRLRRDREG